MPPLQGCFDELTDQDEKTDTVTRVCTSCKAPIQEAGYSAFGESPEYPASWMGALHEVQTRVTVSVFSSWSVRRRESSPSRRKKARTSAKSAHKSHSKSKFY
jgi:hypothetical protein